MTQYKLCQHYFFPLLLILGLAASTRALAEQNVTLIFDAEMPVINESDSGNYAQLASVVDLYRKKNANTFFIFGGESLGPSMLSSMDRGAHIIDILNSLKPSAMGVSKRELSYQEDELILRTYEAEFPIISSNLYDPLTDRAPEGIKTYAILKNANVSLGFISVLDPHIINKYPTKRIEITSPEEAINKASIELKDNGVELIVLHYSVYLPIFDQLLERGVIDVALYKDQDFEFNHYYGAPHHPHNIMLEKDSHAAAVQLTWQNNHPKSSLKVIKHDIDLTRFSPLPSVLQQEQEYARRINTLLEEVLGKTDAPINLDRKTLRTSENGFANLVADTLREFTKADISLVNSGTLRGDTIFSEGSVLTRKDIRTMLPHRNTIELIEGTGKQVIEAIEHGLSAIETKGGQYLQISGIKIKYDAKQPIGKRLLSITLNNKPLAPTKTYKIASLDYLFNGGDGYTMFKSRKTLKTLQISNYTLYDIVAEKVKQEKIIYPKLDGRIIDISTNTKT